MADRILLIVALVVPILCVARWDLRGVIVGALFFWVALVIAGWILSRLDTERGTTVGDTVWLLFGWFGGLLYCLPIYGIKRLDLFFRSRYQRAQAQ